MQQIEEYRQKSKFYLDSAVWAANGQKNATIHLCTTKSHHWVCTLIVFFSEKYFKGSPKGPVVFSNFCLFYIVKYLKKSQKFDKKKIQNAIT